MPNEARGRVKTVAICNDVPLLTENVKILGTPTSGGLVGAVEHTKFSERIRSRFDYRKRLADILATRFRQEYEKNTKFHPPLTSEESDADAVFLLTIYRYGVNHQAFRKTFSPYISFSVLLVANPPVTPLERRTSGWRPFGWPLDTKRHQILYARNVEWYGPLRGDPAFELEDYLSEAVFTEAFSRVLGDAIKFVIEAW